MQSNETFHFGTLSSNFLPIENGNAAPIAKRKNGNTKSTHVIP